VYCLLLLSTSVMNVFLPFKMELTGNFNIPNKYPASFIFFFFDAMNSLHAQKERLL